MHHLKTKFCAAVMAAVAMGLIIAAGCVTRKTTPAPAQAVSALTPGPNDAHIAYWTAKLMENIQYSRQPFDMEMSEKFYDGYLNTIDPRHENFLQSDLDEFAHYRTNLDTYIVEGHERSDLTPAFEIFERLKERLEQHTAYADELLKQDRFKFNTDDRVQLDRRHAPWPADLAAAQQLWRQRLLYEFLLEKLSREILPTNSSVILPLSRTADAEIADKLTHHYNWNLHAVTNWNSDNVLQYYLNALTHAYDPHSDYLNQEHAEDFSINMSLSLFGIGAKLSEQDGYCTIDSLIPGGPAAKSGQFHEKDRVVAVAQSNQPPVNAVDVELPRVVQMIRGPKGTQVRLTLMPANDPAARPVVTLIRDEIKLEDQENKARLIELPDSHGGTTRLGVIDVPSFYATINLPGNTGHSTPKSTTDDVSKLIKKLEEEKVAGIIFDMRGNPGGSLEEAVRFTGLFIKDGPVVLARSPDGSVVMENDPDASQLYSGPLVVLVNRFSASAAEIAAAALQDYDRALIVGDTSTHGKGTVQNLTPLRPFVWPATPAATNDPGTVKITIRKFYRVSGASTQLKGVVPDIVLPDVLNYSTDIGESALDNPLPWDTNAPANYKKLNLIQPYLAELRQRSDARIATNQDFIYTRQDIDQFQKLQADKTATLNEQEAIKQHLTDDARNEAREAERAMRPLPDEKIYTNTVENAELPGLPPPAPLTETNENALLIATNQNGSVLAMTTNNEVVTGIVLSQFETNVPAANSHFGKVITKTQLVDPMLDETERILEDYIALSSSNRTLIADH
jgi:carboxyl-terminal processing protease